MTPQMTPQKHADSTSGPLTNIAAAYCGQLDTAFKAGEPVLRSLSRYQLEWARLATQRTRAWAALPSQLSRCKSPIDLMTLQMQFWQAASLNYAESMQRVWAAAGSATREAATEARKHDFLEVREPALPEAKLRTAKQAAA